MKVKKKIYEKLGLNTPPVRMRMKALVPKARKIEQPGRPPF
jgi:hypothetical protein